jgi:uncharacterized protein YgiM (DUF1202 family)
MQSRITKILYGWSIVLVLFAGNACKKNTEVTDPKQLPDVSQTHPFIVVENTTIRTGPGPQFRTIAMVKQNSKVQAVGKDGEWLLIVSKRGNAPGYVEIAAVKAGSGEEQDYASLPPLEGPYELLADTQVHNGPGLEYPVVSNVKKGMQVMVIGEEKGWLKVQSKQGNPPGFVDKSIAKPKAGV